MNIDLKLDISKLSPAPWHVIDDPRSWPSITSGPADDASERRSVDDPMELPDMVMCAMARNFLDIVMRRGWGIKRCFGGRWMVLNDSDMPVHIGLAGWPDPLTAPDPFTAVVEAEKWWVANMEGKQ